MKRRIFLAAVKLFGDQGFARVSMRDIAREVGIQAASIYNHYVSKDQILNDILRFYVNTAHGHFNEVEQRARQPGYELKLADVAHRFPPEEVDVMRSITRILYIEQFTSPVAADILVGEGYQNYSRGAQRFFQTLYQRGVIKRQERVERYTEMFTRVAMAYQLEWAHHDIDPTERDMLDLYRWMLGLILHYEGATDVYERLADEPLQDALSEV